MGSVHNLEIGTHFWDSVIAYINLEIVHTCTPILCKATTLLTKLFYMLLQTKRKRVLYGIFGIVGLTGG